MLQLGRLWTGQRQEGSVAGNDETERAGIKATYQSR
jgi:hypothetical protein